MEDSPLWSLDGEAPTVAELWLHVANLTSGRWADRIEEAANSSTQLLCEMGELKEQYDQIDAQIREELKIFTWDIPENELKKYVEYVIGQDKKSKVIKDSSTLFENSIAVFIKTLHMHYDVFFDILAVAFIEHERSPKFDNVPIDYLVTRRTLEQYGGAEYLQRQLSNPALKRIIGGKMRCHIDAGLEPPPAGNEPL